MAAYPRIAESTMDGEGVTVDNTTGCKALVMHNGNVIDSDIFYATTAHTFDFNSRLNA